MSEPASKTWRINNSRYLVNDRWLKLRVDSCTTPDGHVIEPYYVFEYLDWVNCFVVDENDDVLMVQQYRHGVNKYVPEIVGGGIEAFDDSPEEGIRRELEEELGYVGGEVHPLGSSYPNAASYTNRVHSFIAIGGSCRRAQKLEKSEDLHIIKVSLKELAAEFESGKLAVVYQSTHLATILLALNFIRYSGQESARKLRQML